MKKLGMLILLAFGLYGCSDPPPHPISRAAFEARVMTECMKRLGIDPEAQMYDTSLEGWRSKVENFEKYYAHQASKHPTDGRWVKAIERLELVDRDVSRCNADLVLRTELLPKIQKEADAARLLPKEKQESKQADMCGSTPCPDWEAVAAKERARAAAERREAAGPVLHPQDQARIDDIADRADAQRARAGLPPIPCGQWRILPSWCR